jgi:hypothetical protein
LLAIMIVILGEDSEKGQGKVKGTEKEKEKK